MSVFTPVNRSELEDFLTAFDLGRLLDYQGIEGGSENSNFFVATSRGEYVLTLIERGPVQALDFFIQLLAELHESCLPVPYAIENRNGQCLQQLNGRPALLQPRLPGKHLNAPNPSDCQAVGTALAQLHQASSQSRLERRSDRGLDWLSEQGALLAAELETGELRSQLERTVSCINQWRQQPPALPRAIVHADLFRDNVMFDGHHLSGIIDFYNAHSGITLYDVAIACNDWCVNSQCQLDPARTRALLAGYAALRPFNPAELDAWPEMLRIAALRFWLSRQHAATQHQDQPGVLVKDPAHFQRIFAQHRQVSIGLPLAL
ncbi:homoserine kinase [Halopseudomonas salegens]|uniref:Homoserine kinase n=1 Tax=Halopseudomonas salegens TaxID=1434072 RepID=A0A1H2HZH5_9GAMM|nr:homoserine kinase [Halopseudomonas salegens]SDU37301.1 homoserine kinase [Halopseudomonas salegens]